MKAVTLTSLSDQQRDEYFAWIGSLNERDDNEETVSFGDWLKLHCQQEGDTVFVFYDQQDQLLGTISVVTEDRDFLAKSYSARFALGGFQVCRAQRGRGIGWSIVQHVDQYLQQRACDDGSFNVCLHTSNPASYRLWERAGYVSFNDNGDGLALHNGDFVYCKRYGK
jgi:GNAT superfamily N-acetyltransferase